MAALDAQQKAFIVRSLARCVSPDQVIRDFKVAFAAVVTIAEVGACARRNLTPDWQKYFDDAQAEFLDAPAAKQEVRIAMLSDVAIDAKDRKAYDLMAKTLEQIAKECSGFYAPKGTAAKATDPDKGPVTAVQWEIVDPAAPAKPADV